METFLRSAGERYEYETNVLIDCKEKDIEIAEVPISTVYIKNNSGSHFNPIKDSIIIYKLFAKYIISSLSSFVVDILLFTLFVKILPEINLKGITEIFLATIIARILSATYNFIINSKVVFKNQNKNSIIKYFILCIIQMFISAFVVSELFKVLNMDSTLIKVIVDTIIFLINFVIQREWVFKKK
jgi:putative flippase GtrA